MSTTKTDKENKKTEGQKDRDVGIIKTEGQRRRAREKDTYTEI